MIRTILSLLIIAVCSASGTRAQGELDVCGAIRTGELTVPSYRFDILDVRGHHIEGVQGLGVIEISEGEWNREGFWTSSIHHPIHFQINYDSANRLFVSQEVAHVSIALRKKGGIFGLWSKCWDKIEAVKFDFSAPNGDQGFYKVFFPNIRGRKSPLPDSTDVITVTLQYDKKGNEIH